jgi:hypothetical protein
MTPSLTYSLIHQVTELAHQASRSHQPRRRGDTGAKHGGHASGWWFSADSGDDDSGGTVEIRVLGFRGRPWREALVTPPPIEAS